MNKKSYYLFFFALIVPIIATSACSSSGSDGRERATAAPTRTRAIVPTATVPRVADVPTHTPMPVQTPQEDTLLELFEEAYFIGKGGGGWECWEWHREQQPESPAVGFLSDRVCLLGFPLEEQITVSFYAPDGDLLVSGDFITDRGTVFQIHPGDVREEVGWTEKAYDEKNDIISIRVTWPVILPAEGYIRALSASAYAEGLFNVGLSPVSVLPAAWENGTNIFGLYYGFVFSSGDEAVIVGTDFEPNNSFPLGIYLENSGGLVLSEVVTTDNQGNFYMRIQIEPSDPAGVYCVLVVTTAPEGPYCHYEEGETFDGILCYTGPIAFFTVEQPG
jgi:hypothetical protein